MKRSKDRLHKVIVIGATPAGIAATNKLGELGIPVTLVDRDPDLNQKLSREQWKLPSGIHFNFAHKSGLLRIFRNPLIRCIMPANVTSIRHTPQGFRARVQGMPTFVDLNRCILCGRCLEVCPVLTPDGGKPILFYDRRSLPGRPVIDKRRKPPCQSNCPLGVNVQAYVALTRAGRFDEALETVRRDNILPGICGRVCTHPCEEVCRRGELDEAIAIKDIKRFLADFELTHPHNSREVKAPQKTEKIAVIGSGPAGLAAAGDLARLGYMVTVFEKEVMTGGLLRYGIGPHRLPRELLDHELDYIRGIGVQFITSRKINITEDLDRLKKEFDAVLLTVGIWTDRKMGIQGEDLEGVEGCLSFLTSLYHEKPLKIKQNVAVIGDGNAAFDLARVLKRLGARVTILSWFPEDLIPADKEEIRGAKEEGIAVKDRTQVISFSGQNGKLDRLRCKPTKPGKPDSNGIPWPELIPGSESFELKFERAIVAIGQAGFSKKEEHRDKISLTPRGFIKVNKKFDTGISGVYAAGDAVSGPSSVVEAMATGRAAAASIHEYICGEDISATLPSRPEDRDFPPIPGDIPSLARPTMPERQPSSRIDNFSEVALGLSQTQVLLEAERCLQCGICSECNLCVEACQPIGAINHSEQPLESKEHAGVVIIADPDAAPQIKGEDVIRAYGPKVAKPDVYGMVIRGFSAAAKSMILLGGTSQLPKGRGVSFSPPDPELSTEIRIGVFICRCNDSMGWLKELDNYVEQLMDNEDIVHAETIPSACIPEGSGGIVRTVREKGITRIVLASCVCCPLDFVCSACTDQRSRLKTALFTGTGVSRSMVETCNLRGEVLQYLRHDPACVVSRFEGLIERSIRRARRLRALPAPARTYNFTTAVIGNSEAASISALTLAQAGLEVLKFGSKGKKTPGDVSHSNIYYFEDTSVRGISGTLGDFQVFVESNGFSQALQVGSVILGEKSKRLIPYISQEGLPTSFITSSMQKHGVADIPFLYPGATPISGLFVANPTAIKVSERKKGAAAAVLAAAIMPRGPRQSKGYTVVIDENRCRGCGRCIQVCHYQAITLRKNSVGGWYAVVDLSLIHI